MTIDFEQRGEFTRELPVQLNDHELQTYGRMLAEKVREEELAEEKKKQVNGEWTAKIKTIRVDIKRIADARAKGEELRPVRCAERLHGNVIEIVRLDRNEVVDTRPADLSDLQTSIPGVDIDEPRGQVVPFLQSVPPPTDFDEGPRDGDIGQAVEAVDDREQPADEPSPSHELAGGDVEGTGAVYDGDGERIGEAVATSVGDVAYVSSEENQDCPACSEPITEEQSTVVDEGMLIHEGCAEEVASERDADLPPPTFTATIGENVEAKTGPKKRDRSKKSNAEKTSTPKPSKKK